MYSMENLIKTDWHFLLSHEFKKDYFLALKAFLDKEYSEDMLYLKKEDIFTAFNLTSYKDTKVVILGQDPYHGKNQAHGLSFSCLEEKLPPSLKNIYKEISNEFNIPMAKNNGDLSFWAKQGVLLLNTTLTVRKNLAGSHRKQGWETFTDAVIHLLNEKEEGIVFLLWGNDAKEKENLITNKHHKILLSAHPSPLSASRGFFGCGHFKMANEFLKENSLKEISWQINDKPKPYYPSPPNP